MKLPFQHKEGEEEGTVPINEVKKLRDEGKHDKEIINQLKSHGYSFQVIEKAMLQALKEGTEPNQSQQSQQQYGSQQRYQQQGSPKTYESQPPQTRQGTQQGGGQGELPTRGELAPKSKLSVPATGQVPLEAQFDPTDLIEEVVEGVVEEKFEKLDSKFEYIHNEHEKLKKENEKLKKVIGSSTQKEDKSIDNLKEEIKKLKEEVEDLSVRSNAFERAFKQFLPDIFAKIRERKSQDKGVEALDDMKRKEEKKNRESKDNKEESKQENSRRDRFSDW